MSVTAEPAVAAAPGPVATLRRRRTPVVVAALVALVAVGVAWQAGSTRRGYLDPGAFDRSGSRAVVTLLRDAGVPVEPATRLDDAVRLAPGATLVVTVPDLLTPDDARRLAAAGPRSTVLVAARSAEVTEALSAGAVGVARDDVGTGVRPPACSLPAAELAGPATTGGATYLPGAAPGVRATACYLAGGRATVLHAAVGDGEQERAVVALGSPRPLQNGWLDEEGNAALALDLLGSADGTGTAAPAARVVWYTPTVTDLLGDDEGEGVVALVPDEVVAVTVWVFVVVVLVAAWRARRLGPLVVEPLPVVVRASETLEGRARLYRRGGDRAHAATLLRAATVERLLPLLGLPPGTPETAVTAAAAARVARPTAEVAALLYGAAPADDAGLVALADALDRLEREVRRS